VVRYAPVKVTEHHNELLCSPFTEAEIRVCSPFTEAEIRVALFMRKPNKAPGLDGFTAGFYQRHWGLLGADICRAVLAFLNGGSMPDVVNDTILVLIPKVKNPQELSQFRPIALCNVLYKICSRVSANRLRVVLNDIISEEQSAFVPGRLITDNVLPQEEKRKNWGLCSETRYGKSL
jgi:hypothetical protein